MPIKVIFFGQLVDMAGASTLEFDGIEDTSKLQEQLHALIPGLADATYRMAVEKKVVTAQTVLPHNATVALLPPFSGG
jgi:sulfur-carrier protein